MAPVHSPVSKRRYKVEAAVHPVVHDVPPVQSAFIVEISLKLIVNVLDDGLEAGQEDTHLYMEQNQLINHSVEFWCVTPQTHNK